MWKGVVSTVVGVHVLCTVVVCPLFAPCRGGGGYEPAPLPAPDADAGDDATADATSSDVGAADAGSQDAGSGDADDRLDTSGDADETGAD